MRHTGSTALAMELFAERQRVKALETAIRLHRDQLGDDRCWMDDEALYKELPEGYTPPERDTTIELENCKRFIECRRNPATEYVSPQRGIEELEESENEHHELREKLARLLSGAAVALKGPEPPLTKWSWHDVPELAERLKRDHDALVKVADELRDRCKSQHERIEELEAELAQLRACIPAGNGDSESFMALYGGEPVTDPCCYCGLQLDMTRTPLFLTKDGTAHIWCHFIRVKAENDRLKIWIANAKNHLYEHGMDYHHVTPKGFIDEV